ncbi:MAG: peroxiredoxin Q/BCP [Parcubacteria group bacterium LiPW_15]|nr:MAG: peroxiredoxin Q/BCP [Parcubacteria group bacterium LiPW_15]
MSPELNLRKKSWKLYNRIMKLKIGDAAPDFTLPDQEGKEHSLSDYRGKWVLVYFYPKDNTPGCTVEACKLRDSIEDIRSAGAEVLGISIDSVESHAGFAKKHELPFPILADSEKKVVNQYGVWGEKKLWAGSIWELIEFLSWWMVPGRSRGSMKRSNRWDTQRRFWRILKRLKNKCLKK